MNTSYCSNFNFLFMIVIIVIITIGIRINQIYQIENFKNFDYGLSQTRCGRLDSMKYETRLPTLTKYRYYDAN